jgi:ABC-type phosphate transport system substrate-binding protein
VKGTWTVRVIAAIAAMISCAVVRADVVVIVNPKNQASSLTIEQIAQYYLGASRALKPMDLPEGSAVRDEFYRKVTNKDKAQIRALWARLIFTGKVTPPKQVASSAAVAMAVAADEQAIGYVASDAVDSSVKVVLKVP